MQGKLEVFVSSDKGATADAGTFSISPFAIQVIATGLENTAAIPKSPIADRIAHSDADFIALATSGGLEDIQRVAMLAFVLVSDPELSAIVGEDDQESADVPPVWGRFLPEVAVLLCRPRRQKAVVFRANRMKATGAFRQVAEPVQDWLIRAVRLGERIKVVPGKPAIGAAAAWLPLLAPPAPGASDDWLREQIESFSFDERTIQVCSRVEETGLRAGIFQWHDFLNESHTLAQSLEGQGEHQLGDYWHAIMHRREPDYSNAKYWFRQIGDQPIFRQLMQYADAIFTDSRLSQPVNWRRGCVRTTPGTHSPSSTYARNVQRGKRPISPSRHDGFNLSKWRCSSSKRIGNVSVAHSENRARIAPAAEASRVREPPASCWWYQDQESHRRTHQLNRFPVANDRTSSEALAFRRRLILIPGESIPRLASRADTCLPPPSRFA